MNRRITTAILILLFVCSLLSSCAGIAPDNQSGVIITDMAGERSTFRKTRRASACWMPMLRLLLSCSDTVKNAHDDKSSQPRPAANIHLPVT